MSRLIGIDQKPLSKGPHVAIAVLAMDQLQTTFAMSLAAMTLTMRGGALLDVRSSLVHHARNLAVKGARANHATHLLFLDSDMKFPLHTLEQLLAHDRDIVGASYPKRTPPHPLLAKLLPGTTEVRASAGLVEVMGLPTGCLLINMRVFDRLETPYFDAPIFTDFAQVPPVLTDYVHTLGEPVGEDYYFCAYARAAGFQVWLDVGLTPQIGHIGQEVYYAQTEEGQREPVKA